MRRIALCLIFIGLAVATGMPQTIDSRQKAEEEVRKAEEARRQALLHNDAAAMERLVADDFVITDNEGRVHDRAEELALYRNARRQTESWEPSDVKVRVYGDMAVVTQRVALQDVLKGQVRNVQMRLTHVWVKRDGRWQCVALHATRISEPPQSTTGLAQGGSKHLLMQHFKHYGYASVAALRKRPASHRNQRPESNRNH